VVYVSQDLDYEGRLYLGTLASLEEFLDSSAGSYIEPNDIDTICIIKRVEKTPKLGANNVFLRKVFLTPWLTQ
jgi:hypothetical protein